MSNPSDKKPSKADIRAYAAARSKELQSGQRKAAPARKTLQVNSNYARQAPPTLPVEKHAPNMEKLMNSHQIKQARAGAKADSLVRDIAFQRAGIGLS